MLGKPRKTFTIRAFEEEIASWKQAAHDERKDTSTWVRDLANQAVKLRSKKRTVKD